MTSLLQAIWNTVKAFGQLVLWALASAVNLIVEAIGAFIGLILALLPNLPTVPEGPGGDAPGWLAWFVPISGIIVSFASLVSMYVVFLIARIALRWVKAL